MKVKTVKKARDSDRTDALASPLINSTISSQMTSREVVFPPDAVFMVPIPRASTVPESKTVVVAAAFAPVDPSFFSSLF